MSIDAVLPLRDLVRRLLQPIVRAIDSPQHALALLRELGYAPPSDVLALRDLAAFVDIIAGLIDGLEEAVSNEDPDRALAVVLELLSKIGQLVQSLNSVYLRIQQEFAGSTFLLQTDILTALPRKLVDYVVVRFLEREYGIVYGVFLLVGVIELEDVTDTPTAFHVPYRKRTVNWERLSQLVTDPIATLQANLDAANEFLYQRALFLLSELAIGLGLPAGFRSPDDAVLTSLNLGTDLTVRDDYDDLVVLQFPLINDPAASVGLDIYPLLDVATGKYTGLALAIRVGAQLEIPLTDAFRLVVDVSANVRDGLGLSISRTGDIRFVSSIFNSPAELAAAATFGIRFSIEPTELGPEGKLISFGIPSGTLLEIGSGSLRLGVEKLDELNLFVEANLKDGLLSIKAEGADSFLATLLPEDGITAQFNLGVGISNRAGLYFTGTSGLYIRLPLHLALGPINIEYLSFGFGFEKDRFPLTLTSGFSALLGPLAAVVEEIGVRAVFTIKSDRSGNLGPLDVSFEFNPPKGVGLAINASVVKGGGYLYFDFDKGEYAGALELTVSNWLSLKAIGLINTKMPGGQPGFSLLVIITAEFNPGFQLGYGFVLLGVGGLLGLNRVMLLDPLLQGVRTGAINSIVFPTNIVANAPKILSDLRTIFPPQEGTFLIGPMAKIGWTTLITLSLGVIIEIPGNVVILGRLGLILPRADDPVLILQVSFVGALEFDKRRIWFFATFFDSRVLFITLEGEMGVLMDFSDNPNFVLSAGGFHPRFTPPPLPFPSLARITLSILNESWGRLRAETYFAVTSNSVQMGCRVEAFFGYDAFSIEGYFGFDALLRFSPLYFIVEISTGFSLKVFGVGIFSVHLRGSLEGPTPWHIRGSAEISFLFFSFSADVDRTFGERHIDTLPPIEVLPKIRAEFEKLESWHATLPASGQLFVSLRDLGSAGTLVLHPVGRLQISQRFAPLNLPLDKIGNQKPSDVKKVTAAVTTSALTVKGSTKEKFAAAQYRDMDDAAKLSAPAYEPLESGVELGASGQPWATGPLAQRNVRYETIIVDSAFERFCIRFFEFWGGLFAHFRAGAAISRVGISLANEKYMQPFASKATVADEQYTVAFQANNRAFATTSTFSSYAEAQAYMTEAVQLDPSLSEEIHVIPFAEVNQTL